MKRGVLFLLVCIFSINFFVVGVYAQENNSDGILDDDFEEENEEIYEGYEDAELEQEAGTMPGSPFYFIDKFFDRFGDDLKVKEERIAEIKFLLEAGEIEKAEEILKDYMELAEELEQEIDPERREDALRSASAIRNAMKDIRDNLPPGERGDFVSEIMSREHSIATAAEIAGKIKELCTQLAELDPVEYSRMCKTDDNDPKWQKKLDEDLTKEQEKIAREFVDIMKECFKTSGQDCRCGDIPFTDFANACSEAAPLAIACDVEGDESACDKLDDLEMPELPDWLQDIWDDLEDGMMESQFEMHMPRECEEEGATNPKECMKIMVRLNAPPECVDALIEANVQNERDGREICEKIMFDLDAPQECLDAGLTNFRECGKLMFQLNAPQECLDAGLTGEHRSDERKCREIAGDDRRGPRGPGGPGGPRMDFNCKEIEDATKRLECFDKASSQVDSRQGGFNDDNYGGPCMTERDWEVKKQECRNLYGEHAGDEPIMGDSGEGYECPIDIKCVDFGDYKNDREDRDNFEDNKPPYDCSLLDCFQGSYCDPYRGCVPDDFSGGEGVICDDCASQCEDIPDQRLRGTGCGPNGCECYYEDDFQEEPEGETTDDSTTEEPTTEETAEEPTTEEETTDDSTTEEPTPEPEPEQEPLSAKMTGWSITNGNSFLDYYFG